MSFWYFPSKVNFALIGTFGSLLLATSPGQEETEFYRTRLSEFRWTLCVSTKSAEFLNFAINSLDSSSMLLRSLPPKPSTLELTKAFATATVSKSTGTLSPPQDETMADAHAPSLVTRWDALSKFRDRSEALRAMDMVGPSSSGLVSPSTSTSSGSPTSEAYVRTLGKLGAGEMHRKLPGMEDRARTETDDGWNN